MVTPYRGILTREQAVKLALADAFLAAIDDLLARQARGVLLYRPLSPMWTQEAAEEWMPDELFDARRHNPPPDDRGGGPFANV
jgi:hypothetical protein